MAMVVPEGDHGAVVRPRRSLATHWQQRPPPPTAEAGAGASNHWVMKYLEPCFCSHPVQSSFDTSTL